jgi:dihydroflavonol-4-reductase
MTQKGLALVSGANGHLGNNLIRFLIKKGIPVRATVRNIKNKAPFTGLDCEVIQADITDKASFVSALLGLEHFLSLEPTYKHREH